MTYPASNPTPDYGAEVDIAAKIDIQLGRLNDHLDAIEYRRREIERRKRMIPMHFDAPGGGAASAAGFAVVDLSLGGLPSMGRRWDVKRWSAGGLGVSATTGTAYLLTTAVQPFQITNAATVPMGDVVDIAAALPYARTFSSRQVIVEPNEALLVVLIGVPANNQVAAGASVDDYDQSAEIGAIPQFAI